MVEVTNKVISLAVFAPSFSVVWAVQNLMSFFFENFSSIKIVFPTFFHAVDLGRRKLIVKMSDYFGLNFVSRTVRTYKDTKNEVCK